MLKQATITNFQSHRETVLDFDPGINVFIGSSDCGKSAALRALTWAISNTPGGNGFMSHWARGKEPTKVALDFIDGSVTRVKGGSKNTNEYLISGMEPMGAIGTGVPEEVQRKLDIGDVSISFQHDAPFLLTMTPGEVGKYLNAIVKLDAIDTIQADIESERRALNKSLKDVEQRKTTKEEQLAELSWVAEAQELVSKTEQLLKKQADSDSLHSSLETLVDQYAELQQRSIDPAILNKADKLFQMADDLFGGMAKRQGEIDQIQKLVQQYDSLDGQGLDEAVIMKADRLLVQLGAKVFEFSDTEATIATIRSAVQLAENYEVKIQKNSLVLKQMENDIQENAGALVCPTCNRPFGGDHDIHG